MTGALDGLVVLELGAGIPSGFCGRLLAGFGATVVKVEPPDGDPARHARVVPGAPRPDPESAPLFAYLGMGKRSLVGSRGDDEDVLELARSADVIVDDRLGAYEYLCNDSPGLIYLSLTPFGTWGPYSNRRAENITAFGMGGQMALTGDPQRTPLCTAGEQAWYQQGLAGFAAVCVAIHERDRSGLGQHLDVAAVDVMAGALEGFGPNAHSSGTPTPRSGTHRLSLMGIYPTSDGHAGIFAMMRQLPTLATLLSRPELPDELRVSGPEELMQRAAALKDIIGAFFAANTRETVRALARETGLPMAPVASVAEVADNEHLSERDFFARIEAGGRAIRVPGPPARMPASPWTSASPPRLGELSREEARKMTGHPPGGGGAFRVGQVPGARPIRLDTRAGGPLAGLRVVDMTQYWLGPYCCKWLADFGADVIKIESPQRMDFIRTLGGARGVERPYDRSAYFNDYNRGKRSLAIDPTTPDGRQALLDLVAVSDVLVENFTPTYMTRIGLPYETLREVRPDLVMLSASAYGSAGPDSALAGVGTNMEQLSGIASLNAYEDDPQPYNSGIAYGDPNGGNMAAAAVLMALRHRARTGEGQHIDLAAHEVLVSLIGEQIAAIGLGLEPAPKGNAHPDMVPHGCYPCEGDDRWVTLALRDEDAWPRLAALLGREDLSRLGFDERRRESYEIDVSVMSWTAVRTDIQAASLLQGIGVAAAPVLTTNDLLDDANLRVRGYFVTVDDPDMGPWPHDGIAWRLSRTPGRLAGPAPRFGQHTREVLREVLGYDEARIEALYASGAAADAPTR